MIDARFVRAMCARKWSTGMCECRVNGRGFTTHIRTYTMNVIAPIPMCICAYMMVGPSINVQSIIRTYAKLNTTRIRMRCKELQHMPEKKR